MHRLSRNRGATPEEATRVRLTDVHASLETKVIPRTVASQPTMCALAIRRTGLQH